MELVAYFMDHSSIDFTRVQFIHHTRGGKINCPYCPDCPTACTDKWKFSRIHYINIIRTSKNTSGEKRTSMSKSDFAGPAHLPWQLTSIRCIHFLNSTLIKYFHIVQLLHFLHFKFIFIVHALHVHFDMFLFKKSFKKSIFK